MLKIYDENGTFLKLIEVPKTTKIETSLETGLKTLSFKLPVTDEYLLIINQEGYVETSDYRYVIKEVNYDQHGFFKVYCNADIEELKYSIIPVYDVIDQNVEAAMRKALTYISSSWTLEYNSNILNAVEYKLQKKSAYEILEIIKADFNLELIFDTKNKVIKVYTAVGKNRGIFLNNELKIKILKRQGQSYDLCTVLYPIGKNGLTIGSINNGVNFIENYQYTNKYLPKYYIDQTIEEAQLLKAAAQAYLNYYSTPIVGYSIDLSSLPKDIGIGDTIILVDKIKRIKQKQRVVKIIQYPFEPEKDKVEISNQIVNFANMITHYNTNYENQIAYIKANLATLE